MLISETKRNRIGDVSIITKVRVKRVSNRIGQNEINKLILLFNRQSFSGHYTKRIARASGKDLQWSRACYKENRSDRACPSIPGCTVILQSTLINLDQKVDHSRARSSDFFQKLLHLKQRRIDLIRKSFTTFRNLYSQSIM